MENKKKTTTTTKTNHKVLSHKMDLKASASSKQLNLMVKNLPVGRLDIFARAFTSTKNMLFLRLVDKHYFYKILQYFLLFILNIML